MSQFVTIGSFLLAWPFIHSLIELVYKFIDRKFSPEKRMEQDGSIEEVEMEVDVADGTKKLKTGELMATNTSSSHESMDLDETTELFVMENWDPCLPSMAAVINNEHLVNKILTFLSVKDRNNAKLVCRQFREELRRKKFLKDEVITVRNAFDDEELERMDAVLDRPNLNMKFTDVASFEEQPLGFWQCHGEKILELSYKECKLNRKLLKTILFYCPNLLNICGKSCDFDDLSGWYNVVNERELDNVRVRECVDSDYAYQRRDVGKFYFAEYLKEYFCRIFRMSEHIHLYSDNGIVHSFIFEMSVDDSPKFLGLEAWEKKENITLYSVAKLNSEPHLLKGWPSFPEYYQRKEFKKAYIDHLVSYNAYSRPGGNRNKLPPRWVTLSPSQLRNVTLYNDVKPHQLIILYRTLVNV